MPLILRIITIDHWPLWIAMGILLTATLSQHLIGRIPNLLSATGIVIGWVVAVVLIGSGAAPSAGGGIGASLAATFLALGLLLPFWITGKIPGGCVKAQMAFGTWTGCALNVSAAAAVTAIASLTGAVFTVLLLQISLWRYKQELARKEADDEAFGTQRVDENDRPRLFPSQLTLTLGSIAGVLAALSFGLV